MQLINSLSFNLFQLRIRNFSLKATAMFAEKAASLESTSALAMAEVGQQCLLRGKVKEAQRYYKVFLLIVKRISFL